MVIKKLLGEILIDMGYISSRQLDEALEMQNVSLKDSPSLSEPTTVPLLSSSDLLTDASPPPLLGQVLKDMGIVTVDQLAVALERQNETFGTYRKLDSEKLGVAIEIGSLINSTLNLAEVLNTIMRHVNTLTDSVASSLILLDERSGELVFSLPTGPKANKLRDIRIPKGKGIAGWVVESGQPAIVHDARTDNRFYAEIDMLSGLVTKSILCVPLRLKSKTIGVLEVINKTDGSRFTEEDALILSILGCNAAVAIENARLHSELKQQYEDQRQGEARRLKLERRLSRAQRMESIGTLAGGIAHQFNNAITGIMGNLDMLALSDLADSPELQKRIGLLRKSAEKMTALTAQLLAYARGGKHRVRTIALNEFMKLSLPVVKHALKPQIRMEVKPVPENLYIKADVAQLQMVLSAILSNASEAVNGDATIRIECAGKVISASEAGAYPNLQPGPQVTIAVSDDGVGMDTETRNRIFEPFFTTNFLGRGLGMAAAYGIVRNHDGWIAIDSELGRGTTVTVYLPAVGAPVECNAKTGSVPANSQVAVLLVEDEKMVMDVTREMFVKLGYSVLEAQTGEAAVKIAEQHENRIDLAVLDTILPDMEGISVYHLLKKARPELKVIVCSGYPLDGPAQAIMESGAVAFIQKPFSFDTLIETLKNTLPKL